MDAKKTGCLTRVFLLAVLCAGIVACAIGPQEKVEDLCLENLQVLSVISTSRNGWIAYPVYWVTVKNEWGTIYQFRDVEGPPPLWQGMQIRKLRILRIEHHGDYHQIFYRVVSVEESPR